MTDTSAVERLATSGELPSVGILGGTFNPPHLGHLAIASHARDELELDRVLLMPAHMSPHKAGAPDPGPEHRLRMCQLLIKSVGRENASRVSACAREIERGGSSYTVDTLRAIHASHPDVELTFIVGADIASTLPTWHEPAQLLGLADLAVAARAGADRQAVLDAIAPLRSGPRATDGPDRPGGPGQTGVVRFLDAPLIEISSSQVRERAALGQAIDDLVGPAVAGYIGEHELYRSPAGAGS